MSFVGRVEATGAWDEFEDDVVVFGFEGGGIAEEGGEEGQAWIGYIGFKAVC